jgi:hypothetical protein
MKNLQGRSKWRKNKQDVETQAQKVFTLVLDQITKFIYRLYANLGEGSV